MKEIFGDLAMCVERCRQFVGECRSPIYTYETRHPVSISPDFGDFRGTSGGLGRFARWILALLTLYVKSCKGQGCPRKARIRNAAIRLRIA